MYQHSLSKDTCTHFYSERKIRLITLCSKTQLRVGQKKQDWKVACIFTTETQDTKKDSVGDLILEDGRIYNIVRNKYLLKQIKLLIMTVVVVRILN